MPALPTDLSGRVALITGASRGIGRAIAEAYAEAGARVVLASRKQSALDAVADAIQTAGGEALPVATHTGNAEAVAALVERTVETYGGIDIVVNNAATNPHFGPVLTAEESHWDKTFEVNVKGYFHVVKACAPVLRERGGGKVINLASVAGKAPQPGMGVYCVTKAGVLMLTEVLAVELADWNIQVNAIVPGFVRTAFSRTVWDNDALHDAVLRAIPQHRMAAPEELTGLALYLASSGSDFVTGASFVIDGGQLAGSSLFS